MSKPYNKQQYKYRIYVCGDCAGILNDEPAIKMFLRGVFAERCDEPCLDITIQRFDDSVISGDTLESNTIANI